MQRRYVTMDVFTDQPFGGNPLAVVLDAQGLSAARMQSVAREFNYSETCFVLPPADPAHTARVRIFTPGSELPFAGHPNIGTALVLARRAAPVPRQLVFEEAAGLVPLDIRLVDGAAVAAELTAPAAFSRGAALTAGAVAAAIGLGASDLPRDGDAPCVASAGLPFAIMELANRDALRRVAPDAARLGAILAEARAAGVLLFVRDGDAGEVQARMFSPLDGIGEDPATGSAAVALAGLLAERAPARDLDFAVRIAQGVDMGRPSLLRARAVKRDGAVVSTHVGGQAVEMMQGNFVLAGDA